MKKRWIASLLLMLGLVISAWQCSSLNQLGQGLGGTNVVWVTNRPGTITNITITTNNSTNFVTNYTIIWTSTNHLTATNAYQPLPSSLWVYVDAAPLAGMSDPRLNYWSQDFSHTGMVTPLSNVTNAGVPWLVYNIPGVDYYQHYELKLRDGPAGAWEDLNGGNGGRYKRVVTFPLLTENSYSYYATTNINTGVTNISNFIYNLYSTKDQVYISPPDNWWETYTYFFSDETNLFRSYPGNIWDDEWFGAEYKGNSRTFFKLYAPNVRRAYVTGDFNNWTRTPLYLDRGRVYWWGEVSNTQAGQAYKFVIEQYPNQWGGPYTNYISDPAAKKNEYSPAMNTAGNKSYIIDQSSYTWQNGWTRPGYDWYIIYQMHIRSWWTNGAGSYYGQGTFETATHKFSYLQDLGFTAIEPLPINEFAGDLSWGYNYVMFYAPESSYVGTTLNTVDPFKNFVDEAHGHGMAVILDLVFNHMGASDDVIASYDGADNWDWPDTYWYNGKTDWGPRFNYGNPVVRKFLIDSAKYMMKHYRVDGFRFDATAYINSWSFMQELTSNLKGYASGNYDGWNSPNLYLIAENLPNDAYITRKTTSGGAGFDSQWNVNMSHELKDLFRDGDSAFDIPTISSTIAGSYLDNGLENQNPNGTPAINYLVSHDEAGNGKQRPSSDLAIRWWSANTEYDSQHQQITGLATSILSRGVPMIFMGEEFIQGFYGNNTKYFIVDDANSWYVNWENLSNSAPWNRWGGYYTHKAVKDLIQIRKDSWPVRGSSIRFDAGWQDNANKIIRFARGSGNGSGDIFVVINYKKYSWTDLSTSTYGVDFPSTGTWNLIFASPSGTYGQIWADAFYPSWMTTVVYTGGSYGLRIPEYGVLIYRKQ